METRYLQTVRIHWRQLMSILVVKCRSRRVYTRPFYLHSTIVSHVVSLHTMTSALKRYIISNVDLLVSRNLEQNVGLNLQVLESTQKWKLDYISFFVSETDTLLTLTLDLHVHWAYACNGKFQKRIPLSLLIESTVD